MSSSTEGLQELRDEVKTLEASQAGQAATVAGGQATQAAAQAGLWSTMGAGATGLIIGIFLGLAISDRRR